MTIDLGNVKFTIGNISPLHPNTIDSFEYCLNNGLKAVIKTSSGRLMALDNKLTFTSPYKVSKFHSLVFHIEIPYSHWKQVISLLPVYQAPPHVSGRMDIEIRKYPHGKYGIVMNIPSLAKHDKVKYKADSTVVSIDTLKAMYWSLVNSESCGPIKYYGWYIEYDKFRIPRALFPDFIERVVLECGELIKL